MKTVKSSLSLNLHIKPNYAFEGCKDITSIDACMLTPVKITKETFLFRDKLYSINEKFIE